MEEEKQASSHTVAILEWQLEKILNQIKHQDLKSLITALVFASVFGVFYSTTYRIAIGNHWKILARTILSLIALVSAATGIFLIFKSITRRKPAKNRKIKRQHRK